MKKELFRSATEHPPKQHPESKNPSTFIPTNAQLISALIAATLIIALCWGAYTQPSLEQDAALTLSIFIIAIWGWIFTPLADTYIALAAALAVVLTGVIDAEDFSETLGTSTIWLLIAAVIIARGISSTGLAERYTALALGKARSTRSLFYLLTLALFFTSFIIPSTSGRAALALPIFTATAQGYRNAPTITRALSLLTPSVILLSSVSSYIGAGAHLITDEILHAEDIPTIGFLRWMLWGAGLGLTSALICCEIILRLFLTIEERRTAIPTQVATYENAAQPHTRHEKNVLTIVIAVAVLWCTEPLHGIDTMTVTVLGALLITAPTISGVSLSEGIKKAPWPILIFMAATLALGEALVESGAAHWLGSQAFSYLATEDHAAGYLFLALIILISTAAHLIIQSRSARSAVLIPIIITSAIPLGIAPQAAAFISTAAGFCRTLPSSAKPVMLFSQVEGHQVYQPADLLKLSYWLAPAHMLLICIFTLTIWPWLGMEIFTKN